MEKRAKSVALRLSNVFFHLRGRLECLVLPDEIKRKLKLKKAIKKSENAHILFKREINAQKINDLNEKELAAKAKKTEVLFVLGSGSSINRLSQKNWDYIRLHDSFGFNHWVCHEFVPDFYMFEVPRDRATKNILIHNLQCVWEEYSAIPKILKPLSPYRPPEIDGLPAFLVEDLIYCHTISVGGENKEAYRKNLEAIEVFCKREGMGFPSVKHQARASLDQIINFGLGAGYEKIVLCGVDLNSISYFYEEESPRIRADVIKPSMNPHGEVHRTMDPAVGSLTIDQVIEVQNNFLARERGASIHVAFRSSALYPMLPSFFD